LDEELHKKIDKLESIVGAILQAVPVITEQPKPPASLLQRILDWLIHRFKETSTLQGLVILIPMGLTKVLDMDERTATEIVLAALTIVAGHNVVRSEKHEN
jgi:hypothetical protein